jgi:hypothetical protein
VGNAILVGLGAIAGAVGTIAIGLIGNVAFHIWSEKRAKPAVDTFGFYYDGFPKGLTQVFSNDFISDEVWTHVPKEKQYLLDNQRLYTFFLQATGSAVITDLKIKAYANDGSGIALYKFIVDKQIICDRLSVEQDKDRSVTASWAYLNPGEFLEFYVLATAVSDRADVTIDVDGLGISIREMFPAAPVNLMNPLKYPFISAKSDQFLLRFVRNVMVAMSYGEEKIPTFIKPR